MERSVRERKGYDPDVRVVILFTELLIRAKYIPHGNEKYM